MSASTSFDEYCGDCNHKRENHMAYRNTGRTDCHFPECDCHQFRL